MATKKAQAQAQAQEKKATPDFMKVKGAVVRADFKKRSFTTKKGKKVEEKDELYHFDVKISSIVDKVFPDDMRYCPSYLDEKNPSSYANFKSRYSFPIRFADCEMGLDEFLETEKSLYGLPCVVKVKKSQGNLYPYCVSVNAYFKDLEEKKTEVDFSDMDDFDTITGDFMDENELPFE